MKKAEKEMLFKVRNEPETWADFGYDEAMDEEDCAYDRNEDKRDTLLSALEKNLLAGDEALLRYLVSQEIAMHRAAPYQGLMESLRLACTLLAHFRNPKNVWLFAEAKSANFDTSLGLDAMFLLSAGIQRTFDYVASATMNDKESFYFFAGERAEDCFYSEEELAFWWDAYHIPGFQGPVG